MFLGGRQLSGYGRLAISASFTPTSTLMASTRTRSCLNFKSKMAGNFKRFTFLAIVGLTAAIWIIRSHGHCTRLQRHLDDNRPPPEYRPQRSPLDFQWKVPGDAHVDGFTLLDSVYLHNGTLCVVSVDPPLEFPSLDKLLSQPEEPPGDTKVRPRPLCIETCKLNASRDCGS